MLAGGCGVLLRYLLNKALLNQQWSSLPLATLIANVVGSFLIGYLSWVLLNKWQMSTEAQIIMLTGFLGGFTTFSAFSLEVVTMFNDGFSARALGYVLISVLLSVSMCLCGLLLAKST